MIRPAGWALALVVVFGFILLRTRWRWPAPTAPRTPSNAQPTPRPLKPRTPDDCPVCRAAHPGLPPASIPPKLRTCYCTLGKENPTPAPASGAGVISHLPAAPPVSGLGSEDPLRTSATPTPLCFGVLREAPLLDRPPDLSGLRLGRVQSVPRMKRLNRNTATRVRRWASGQRSRRSHDQYRRRLERNPSRHLFHE